LSAGFFVMSDQSTSLIQRDADQALLWSPDEIPAEVLEVESTEGHYSGDRLMSQRPAIYRAIVYLLGCGVPRRTISDKLRVHHKTVAAVAARESESIAAQKREVAAMARHGQAMVLDSLLDDIASGAKISAKLWNIQQIVAKPGPHLFCGSARETDTNPNGSVFGQAPGIGLCLRCGGFRVMFAFITNLNHYASMLCAFVVLFWFCYRVGSAANAAARACGCG